MDRRTASSTGANSKKRLGMRTVGFAGGIPREDGSAENVLLRLHKTLAVCGTARNLFRSRRALSARKRPRRPGRGLAGTLAQTPRAVPAKPSGRVFRKRIGTGSDRSASRVREDLLPYRAVPVSAPRAGHERRRPDSGIAARGTPDAGTAHARRKRNVFDALFSRIDQRPLPGGGRKGNAVSLRRRAAGKGPPPQGGRQPRHPEAAGKEASGDAASFRGVEDEKRPTPRKRAAGVTGQPTRPGFSSAAAKRSASSGPEKPP